MAAKWYRLKNRNQRVRYLFAWLPMYDPECGYTYWLKNIEILQEQAAPGFWNPSKNQWKTIRIITISKKDNERNLKSIN